MASTPKSSVLLKKHLHGRINKILALVPRHRAPSEASSKSDSDEELHVPPSPDSYFSSPALSIASSLELLNLLDSDENERERDDEPLPAGFSPILQEVFPSPSQEPVYSNLPSMSSLPSLPTPPSVAVTVRRKTRSKVPVVVAKKAKKPKKKFSLTYKWKKVPFQHRVETLEDDFEDLDIQEIESPLEYFYKFFSRDIIEDIILHGLIQNLQTTNRMVGMGSWKRYTLIIEKEIDEIIDEEPMQTGNNIGDVDDGLEDFDDQLELERFVESDDEEMPPKRQKRMNT
ncbi:hypothetical protein PYW07_000239 [Mythimna separata]|uniref:Uncharacterized protein n=1 Tax=Mythimna separata TaxID=271217 RepID=A0AAD7Z187_MYTSE|nr:hypothetical protein PYW07_000239 [Mythimna separata]